MEPSTLQKAKMGLCIGLVFGGFTVLRYGPGSKGYIGTVGQYMMQSGASFAFFLSIGSVLRGESARNVKN